jgi:hypothetical protein
MQGAFLVHGSDPSSLQMLGIFISSFKGKEVVRKKTFATKEQTAVLKKGTTKIKAHREQGIVREGWCHECQLRRPLLIFLDLAHNHRKQSIEEYDKILTR